MNKDITSQDVSNWMREQLEKAHEINDYASISVRVSASRDSYDKTPIFAVYLGKGWCEEGPSLDGCLARLVVNPPKSELELIADEIDSLTAKRDALLEAEAVKNQTTLSL